MKYPELVVTYKIGGVHIKSSDGDIDVKTSNLLTVLNIVGSAGMQTRVEYSSEPLYPKEISNVQRP